MSHTMTLDEVHVFLSHGTRTAKLAIRDRPRDGDRGLANVARTRILAGEEGV